MALPVGSTAPDFTLKTSELADYNLYSSIGNSGTLLLFFPGAFTAPCTEEMCSNENYFEAFKALGIEVIGISADSAFALAAWKEQKGISITLLSDYTHKVIALYDVVLPDLAGLGPSSQRAAVFIDANRVIQYSEQSEKPTILPNFDAISEAIKRNIA